MISSRLLVLMHDSVAGVVTSLPRARHRFAYDATYAASPGATPVSLTMPLDQMVHGEALVAPWLAGLLPEDDAVRSRWAQYFQVASTPFSLLGTPAGEDCAGAVRFCREQDADRVIGRGGGVEWLDEAGVESIIADLQRDTTAWLGRDFAGQFSLAGVQAKTALHSDGVRWGRPWGDVPTTHILKPAIPGFADHEINEHLCLDAARRVGILAARSRVMRFGSRSVIVVERYDRARRDGRVLRVHQEDTCQALGLPPTRKYESDGGPSAAAIIALFRRWMPPSVADAAAWRFVDALIWNWLIAGTDAHAKNYSLLLSGRDVRLAPFYDIASALPYGVHVRKLRMAMRVGGDRELDAIRWRWERAANEWGLNPDRMEQRVRSLAEAAPDAFADAAADESIAALGSRAPARLVDRVARRVRDCQRGLAAEDAVGEPPAYASRTRRST